MSLADRLPEKLTTSGPKAVLLAILMVIGLYFWIPLLWRAIHGSTAVATETGLPVDAAMAATSSVQAADNWEASERLLAADELYRSAGRADVRVDAFRLSPDYLPLDVEFAAEPPSREEGAIAAVAPRQRAGLSTRQSSDPAEKPPVLRSTIVGTGRRVALINDRAYAEGTTLVADGRTWTVQAVEPRRVILAAGGSTLELQIEPFAKIRNRP